MEASTPGPVAGEPEPAPQSRFESLVARYRRWRGGAAAESEEDGTVVVPAPTRTPEAGPAGAPPPPREPAVAAEPAPSAPHADAERSIFAGSPAAEAERSIFAAPPAEDDERSLFAAPEPEPEPAAQDLLPADASPAQIAARSGADGVADLLAVSAAWLTLVGGRPRFSRREVMEVFDQIPGDHPKSLEARIKGYGKLVRGGALVLVDDGLFALSQEEQDRYRSLLG